jgi:predicted enzyme related to lactoylglutathione lyase
MSSRLFAISFDAHQPESLARFWSGVLDLGPGSGPDPNPEPYGEGVTLPSGNDAGYRIGFRPSQARKTGQNRLHFDLTSSSPEDQRATVARALALGARHADVGQGPDADHVVLADPEGNEFCVIEPGNKFLAGCGRVGALACDGSQAVGYFWSRALGWPLVWDQDEETAIQSPDGGTKITWGGPPRMPDPGRDLHLDLVADTDQQAEAERLLSLGARRLDGAPGAAGGAVLLADPDGNEFRLLPPR